MDTVTYPHEQVKQELTNWVVVKIDVAEHRELAQSFEVVGIPVAIVVTPAGDEIDRLENFIEPTSFRSRLERTRLQSKP